ncbi:MAG: alpha-hydroxy acid oxidase [Actinomycetota bacterium]
MSEPLNLDEFETLARAALSEPVYDYYAGGAEDEVTVRENREAFQRIALRYRVLVDVAERDTSTEILGTPLSFPVILAPTALHRMAHPDGERATARAAAEAGVIMCLSSISSVAMEEVADAAPDGARWFQLYHFADRAMSESLIARAHASGYSAIVLTADAPLLGRRERDLRHPFTLPDGVEAAHFKVQPRSSGADSPLTSFVNQPSINWTDLAWVRAASPLPVIVKGIVRADDTKRALDEGCAGIWVSNHGGRQLDTSIPTAQALPEIVATTEGRVPVIVDGGIRRGTDVLKSIALGATVAAIGRPQLWGLTVGGEAGVAKVLELLRDELSLSMALAGARTIAEIDPSLVV